MNTGPTGSTPPGRSPGRASPEPSGHGGHGTEPRPDDPDHAGLHEHVERHRDGSVRGRGPMDGEIPHGYWEWFRLDGTLMRSGTFDHGVQVGDWTTYDRAGVPHKVTRMRG
ncbi:hypothetical protein Slu03_02780 [Sediminihabitans luteus]|uniref:toxin-antitoxin system YwqK family antitoxin n=1 Tax=Sediminihabitans luteus TaxID=1138585 RepID=UPI000C24E882|nr:hypothetical protein [Sediminihabitans luteus]GII97900.1 hypothetical protein Slu03_02780 [Sediminihabitans luteus]